MPESTQQQLESEIIPDGRQLSYCGQGCTRTGKSPAFPTQHWRQAQPLRCHPINKFSPPIPRFSYRLTCTLCGAVQTHYWSRQENRTVREQLNRPPEHRI